MFVTRSLPLACLTVAILTSWYLKPAAEPEAVRPVRAVQVGDLKAIQGRDFPGRAKARDEVDLSFRVSGPLVSLPAEPLGISKTF